jgi:hypothetical protein
MDRSPARLICRRTQTNGRGRRGKIAYELALVNHALPFRTSTKDVAFTARCGEHSEARGCSSHCAVLHRGTNVEPSPQHKGRQR